MRRSISALMAVNMRRTAALLRLVMVSTQCGKLRERRKRAAAFVVHQHEIQDARIVVERQADDQRHQQLGLAGAGAAGDQAVDAIVLGLQVHLAQPVARHHADRHAQPVGQVGLLAFGPLAPA